MMVVNKIDQASAPALALLRHSLPEAYYVSARTGEGIEALQQSIADCLPWPGQRVRVVVKWENTGLLERIYRDGKLLTRQNRADGTFIDAWVPPALGAKLLNQAMEDDCGTSEGDDSGANER